MSSKEGSEEVSVSVSAVAVAVGVGQLDWTGLGWEGEWVKTSAEV